MDESLLTRWMLQVHKWSRNLIISVRNLLGLGFLVGCPGDHQQNIYAGPVEAWESTPHGEDFVGLRCVVANDRGHFRESGSESFGLVPRSWVRL